LFLGDGPSDAPLGRHVEHLASRHGVGLDVVAPDLRRLQPPPGLQVAARARAVFRFDDAFDLMIVHRDAEGQTTQQRVEEVRAGIGAVRQELPCIPVVPIRMTEAWLLVDEAAIRRVAGRPTGREPLALPALVEIEHVPDPKTVLRRALETASGVRGRRLRAFQRDFGAQRRRLLEALDLSGPVTSLSAWRELEAVVESVVRQL
jgi:hypothetical protein